MPLSPALELEEVSLGGNGRPLLQNICMQLPRGRVGALLGPSGCGKTTLLRVIAGLQKPSRGAVRIHGETVCDGALHRPPEKRGTGLVFQDLALFPNCTVAWHIEFGLKNRMRNGNGGNGGRRTVDDLLQLTSLGGMEKRYPHQLSTGQRQRVALARALAANPRLMLLDEPFANLDSHLRQTLADEIMAILRDAGVTTLMVTHDRDEACALADQIHLMRAGHLLQTTPPDWFLRRPYSASLSGLGGYQGFVRGVLGDDGKVRTPLGELQAALPAAGPGAPVTLMVNCEDLRLDAAGAVQGRVTYRNFHAGRVVYTVEVAQAGKLYCLGALDRLKNIGDTVRLKIHSRPLTVIREV